MYSLNKKEFFSHPQVLFETLLTLCPSWSLLMCVSFLLVCFLWRALEVGHGEQKRASKSIIRICQCVLLSMGDQVNVNRDLFFESASNRWSISTIYQFVCGLSRRRSISTIFSRVWIVSTVDMDRISRRWIDGRY